MTLNLTGKHCCVIFPAVFFFFLRNNACKNADFPEPALVANARFTDSIVWKNKSFVWKGRRQEKTAFLHMLFVENERETRELK